MTVGRLVHRSKDRGVPQALSAVAVSLVLIVIVYGIAKPPELTLLSTSGAAYAAQASATPTRGSDRGSAAPVVAVPGSRSVTFNPAIGEVDAPRVCALEAGVSDACIFN
jgi:hypothetical protein